MKRPAPHSEEDFPRGGKGALSANEIREARAEAEAEFSREVKKPNKRLKRESAFEIADPVNNAPKSVELLKFKKLLPGARVLGAVSAVNMTDISISLPNGLHGFAKVDEALPEFHGEVSGKLNKDDVHNLLKESFQVGQLVACSVLDIEEKLIGDERTKKVLLSLLPKHFNDGLTIDSVFVGQLLIASVRSIEDHGYILSFGSTGLSGFLLHKDREADHPYRIGKVIRGIVSAIDKKRAVVNLREKKLSSSMMEHENLSFSNLLPGAFVKVRVQSVLENGLLLSFLSYFTGTVDVFHLESDLPGKHWANEYSEGKQLSARILFTDPKSKNIRISLRPHLFDNNISVLPVSKGDKFENAIIRRVDHTLGLLLELPGSPSVPAYVNLSDVSDEKVEKMDKRFREGQKVRACVTGCRLLDGLASASMKESVFEGVFNVQSLKAGMVIRGEVTNIEHCGAFVSLGEVKALCPLQHMSEYTRLKPSAKFQQGAKLKFRVLQCDLEKKKVALTYKKTMVSSKLPLLTSFEEAVPGLVTHGFIQGIEPIGCFVEFYNRVKGLVHRSELGIDGNTSIESAFQVGQVVKCRVLNVDIASRRLALSFIISSGDSISDDVQVGKVISAVVTAVGNREMELQVASSKGKVGALMSYYHLSDIPAHAELMKQLVKPGFTFDRLLVLDNRSSKLILSAKHSLIDAAESLPLTLSQLAPQQVIPGYISAICEKSCFVTFLGHLNGLVHIRDASDQYVEDLSKAYQVGQSVRCQILSVDFESRRCLVSLKQSACFSTNVSLIEGYFLETEKIASLKEADSSWTKNLEIGSLVEADVQEIKDYGIILNMKDNADAVGFATRYQCEGPVQVGATVKAAVLDVVIADGIVDLSLRKNIITTSSKKKLPKVYQRVEVIVELVKDEYLVLSMPEFDNAIGFASTRDYNMRMLRSHDYYYPGQRLMATFYKTSSVGDRGLLLIADKPTTSKPHPLKTIEIGALVYGRVLEVGLLHMLVEVERGVHGKVHITEVIDDYESGNPFKSYGIGQAVRARVLSKHKPSRKKNHPVTLELSLRLSESAEIITFETVKAGLEVIGYVQEVNDEWAWLVLAPHTRGRLHILHSSDDIAELEQFRQRFKVGDAVKCHVTRVNHEKKIIDLSMRLLSWQSGGDIQIKEGDILPGRISKVLDGVGGLTLQLGPSAYGRVHVTHLGDVWLNNPASVFTEGKFVRCRVRGVNSSGEKTIINLSLRPSLGGDGGFDSIVQAESADAFREHIVNSIKDLQPNMRVQGFVKAVCEKGCFVILAPKLDARILLKHLTDSYIQKPAESFPIGTVVTGRVLTVEPLSRRVDLALTSVPAAQKEFKDFHVGDVVTGKVRRIESFGIFMSLAGSDIVGLCHVSEASDDFISDLSTVYSIGQKVQAKILKVDSVNKRISLGMKASYIQSGFDDQENDMAEEEDLSGVPAEAAEPMEVDEEAPMNVDTPEKVVDAFAEPLQVELDGETDEDEVRTGDAPRFQKKKKLSKKEKKRLKEEREAAIRAAEERLLQDDRPPETVDDFERLVRASPNSSYVWIKYMAFWLRLADVDKARAAAERALETISYREETEKLNIWTAYLNLENSHGTPPKDAVSKLFERALKLCEPKKLHLALLGIYEKSSQHDLTDELMKTMTRKFKTSTKVWLRHLTNLLSRGLEDKTRKAFDQALQGLPRHKHVKFISRAALIEFKSGSPERAREIFDSVLRNYPKRTDLWSVYIDQEIRLGDASIIRALFERATCLNLPPKKMQFVFKRYLDFEKSQGDEDRIEHVKAKAMEFVDSKGE